MRGEIQAAFRRLDRPVLSALAVLAAAYVASGIFVVEAHQKAVVFQFGRAVEVVGPGIGYHWPWPISTAAKVNVKEVRRSEAGFWSQGDIKEELIPYCITGDKNIIHNRYVIQYRIGDPVNYLCAAAAPQQLLVELAQGTILEAVAGGEVDPILTTGKSQMERAVYEGLAEKLAALDLRIQLVGVERQFAEPSSWVNQAFQDVINAQEENRTRIHEAENYRNQEIPRAQAEAHRMIEQARAHRAGRVNAATGEAERFRKLYREYRTAREVTRSRLLVEMMETVLPRTKVVVLATDAQGQPLRIKLLQGPVPTTMLSPGGGGR